MEGVLQLAYPSPNRYVGTARRRAALSVWCWAAGPKWPGILTLRASYWSLELVVQRSGIPAIGKSEYGNGGKGNDTLRVGRIFALAM